MTQPTDRNPAAAINPAERRESSPASANDITVAQAIAQTVREVPGVLDLSPGQSVLAATYAAGRQVTGVVVHHPMPGDTRIEVHAVLSEGYTRAMRLEAVAGKEIDRSQQQPVLINVAEHIRDAVYRMSDTLHLPSLVRVDVFIDDLR